MPGSSQRIEPYPSVGESLHLRDYWNVVRRRRGLVLFVLLVIITAGAARVATTPKAYTATAQIMIDQESPRVLDFEQQQRAGMLWEDFYQTQYRLLQSRLLAGKVVEKLDLTHDPEFAASGTPDVERTTSRFLDRLKVQPIKNSQLVSITFEAGRPDLAAKAANTLAEVYIQQALAFRYKTSEEAGRWLVDETKEQAKKIEASQKAIEDFKKKQGLVSVEERRMLADQKLRDLGASLTAAKTRRLEKEALYRQMRQTSNPEDLGDVLRSPLIQSLQGEVASLERQTAQLTAAGYLSEHPEFVKVRGQLQEAKKKLAVEANRVVSAAENDYRAAASNEGSVSGALEAAKAEALTLSQKGQEYDRLKRDLEASQQVNDNVLVRQKQTDVVRDAPVSSVHVIDPAVVPRSPIRPRPVRDMALTVLAALVCAIGAAFLFDYLDTSIRNPSDLRALGLPLLGVIPETASRRRRPPVVTLPKGKEAFVEGYRVLRTSLAPEADVDRGQVLMVTSTMPGEGKTLTAVNLALTLAAAHERVLLVDADLRRPALSAWLKAPEESGLLDVLSGLRGPEVIRDVPGTEVKLLAAGRGPSEGTADMLATRAFADLVERLRADYDRIIVDTPPAGAFADALVLAPMADSVLIVARSGRVDRAALVHTLERISNAGGHVRGVVLNRARTDRYRYDYGPAFARGVLHARNRHPLPPASSGPDLFTRLP